MNPKPKLIINAATSKTPPEILIYDVIGPEAYGMISDKAIARALKDVGNAKDISVRINSPGGSVFHGIAIHNQLQDHAANDERDDRCFGRVDRERDRNGRRQNRRSRITR